MGSPECYLASLIPGPVTWVVGICFIIKKVCFISMCWVDIAFFQSLKHWHKCVSNPMWKPTTETELKDGEISPWIYYRLTSACSCVKIDPRLLTPGVFLGVSKYTVLPTHNPFPPPFDSDFLNLENAYSPLRYTHYCLNTCRDGCVRVCCATLLSFSCHGRYHQGPVYTVESDAD